MKIYKTPRAFLKSERPYFECVGETDTQYKRPTEFLEMEKKERERRVAIYRIMVAQNLPIGE